MDGIILDPVRCTATIGGRTERLTDIEYDIVAQLVDADGGVVSKYDLIRSTWGSEMRATPDALRQRMFCLRRKLGRGAIRNVYGYGYRLSL